MLLTGKNSESGRSIVEIIGVLAIMGLITAAAFILIRAGMASQRRSIVDDDVAEIVTGVRTLYADYDSLPSNFDGEGTLAALSIDDNGPYSDSKYGLTRESASVFVIKLKNLPAKECAVLGTKSWASAISVDCQADRNVLILKYNK